jgi:hypothetical protein
VPGAHVPAAAVADGPVELIMTNLTTDELEAVDGGYAAAPVDPILFPTCPGPTFPIPPTDPWS